MHSFLYFIGTGAGKSMSARRLPSYMVGLPNQYTLLLECGANIDSDDPRLPVAITRIDSIVITAANIDLIAGLPSLLHSMRLLNRNRPLTVIAPKIVEELVSQLLTYDHLEMPFELTYRDITDENPFLLGDGAEILTKEVGTAPGKYQVYLKYDSRQQGDVTIYYTGKHKGCYDPEILTGRSIVIHDCTYAYDEAHLVEKTGLASYKDALDFAEVAKPVALLLVHFSSRYQSPWKEMGSQRIHPTNVVFAYDGLYYDISHILELESRGNAER